MRLASCSNKSVRGVSTFSNKSVRGVSICSNKSVRGVTTYSNKSVRGCQHLHRPLPYHTSVFAADDAVVCGMRRALAIPYHGVCHRRRNRVRRTFKILALFGPSVNHHRESVGLAAMTPIAVAVALTYVVVVFYAEALHSVGEYGRAYEINPQNWVKFFTGFCFAPKAPTMQLQCTSQITIFGATVKIKKGGGVTGRLGSPACCPRHGQTRRS